MILFDLRCSQGHSFEAWFRDGASYQRLAAAGGVQCTVCGDLKVAKALMAPAVRTARASAPAAPAEHGTDGGKGGQAPVPAQAKTMMAPADGAGYPEKLVEAARMLRKAQTFIQQNFDHVGRRFAEEARKMHYGEAEKRSIYGEATKDEAEALGEEGIEVGQIPWLPSHDS